MIKIPEKDAPLLLAAVAQRVAWSCTNQEVSASIQSPCILSVLVCE